MTLSVRDCMWQLDKHKHMIQSSRNKGLCSTSPSWAIWSFLPASLTAAVRWSTFGRAVLSFLRQAIILLLTATCQSISTSETHTHTDTLSLCLCGLVKGSASVTRYRHQSYCPSLSLTRGCTTVSHITKNIQSSCESHSHVQTQIKLQCSCTQRC